MHNGVCMTNMHTRVHKINKCNNFLEERVKKALGKDNESQRAPTSKSKWRIVPETQAYL